MELGHNTSVFNINFHVLVRASIREVLRCGALGTSKAKPGGLEGGYDLDFAYKASVVCTIWPANERERSQNQQRVCTLVGN